ncbi:MAG: OmpH family outer membrane protein [Treponema sp.]|nr:OmpH family outer membrane protein [Treponema sp.]
MKRFIFMIVFCCGLLFSLSAQRVVTKVAVVDMNQVVSIAAEKFPELKAFNEKQEKLRTETDKHNKEMEELTAKFSETKESGNQSQIKNLENQIRTKVQNFQNYYSKTKTELEREREQIMTRNSEVMSWITGIIRSVAISEGCSIVINRDNPAILWSSPDPEVDITRKVVERVRSTRR